MNNRNYKRSAVYLLEYILNESVGDEPVKIVIQLGNTGKKMFTKKVMKQTKLSDYFNLTTQQATEGTDIFIYYTFHKKYLMEELSDLIQILQSDIENELFDLLR